MPHRIFLSENGRFIVIKVTGEVDSQYALQQGIEATAYGKELKINDLLFDLTEASYVDSILNTHEHAYVKMKHPAINRFSTVALLIREDDHSHDFVETALRNAGYNVRLFTDYESAVAFLKRPL